jgi:hypothetical protein
MIIDEAPLPERKNIFPSEILCFHLLVALIYLLLNKRNLVILKIEKMIDEFRTDLEQNAQTGHTNDVDETDETEDPASAYLGGEIYPAVVKIYWVGLYGV